MLGAKIGGDWGWESLFSASTHGEPTCPLCPWSLGGGVVGTGWSFVGFKGGDLVSFEEPLPWEDLGSSPLPTRLSASLDFSRSRSRSRSRSLSFSSLTASDDFFLTNPAASRAVVARCMMLTLPDLAFRPLDTDSFSLSFKLPPGVEGCERNEASPVRVEEEGDNIGDLVGDTGRGGVVGLMNVGVGGMKVSCGAVMGTFTSWV